MNNKYLSFFLLHSHSIKHFRRHLHIQILSAAALLVVSFPNRMPTGERHPKTKAALLSFGILLSILLIAGCLSTLISIRCVILKFLLSFFGVKVIEEWDG